MNRLTSVLTETTGGSGPLSVAYQAPDLWLAGGEAGEWYRCGEGPRVWKRQFADDAGWGPWVLEEETAEPLQWPDFGRSPGRSWSASEKEMLGATDVEEFRLLDETDLNGERVWVVVYAFKAPTHEGAVPIRVTEWISKETFWILKVEQWQDDPFGFTGTTTTVYSQHNEPQGIDCPPEGDGVGA